jgi:hypothetical protein
MKDYEVLAFLFLLLSVVCLAAGFEIGKRAQYDTDRKAVIQMVDAMPIGQAIR